VAEPSFAELQATFREFWPTVTLRSIDVERTVVVVHSISFDVPDQLIPVFPAYEELPIYGSDPDLNWLG
jgi:hypothetical protein